MRKMIWCGMLGAMICAAVSYLAADYMGCHCGARFAEDAGLKAGDVACSPGEPHALDALLPDPAKLLADWQAFETIDLLSPRGGSNLAKQDDPAKQPLFGLAPEDSFPQALVPADIIRSADEAECFRLMPYSESRTPPALTLRPNRVPCRSEASEASEEQEAELTEPPADSKIVEERLKRILQSYLQEGKLNGRAGIDTMEFRPSDAKKGEFDRIPF